MNTAGDDDEGSSPYREGGGGPPCPRCGVPMVVNPMRRMTCTVGDCGDWWSKQALEPTLDWRAVETAEPYRVFGAVAPELPCPECTREMVVSLRARVEFAHCDAHGVWLDRRERAVFDEIGGWHALLASRVRTR